jgi:3-deoxy-D-manno-octulosonic-acid transferase
MLVNGRISSRSYPRYRLARWFFRRVLADVDRFCMQSEESARRIIDIGADRARVP